MQEIPPFISMVVCVVALTVVGCGVTTPNDDPYGVVEPGEWLAGGETTNTLLLGSNSFLPPADNLSLENELLFFGGNGFFNQAWVAAPASTTARDGLGPLFNARSCSGCHTKDGRGAPPEDGQGPFVGMLLRLAVPGPDGPVPDPVYGGQLQDRANLGIAPEAIPMITWEPVEGQYADGTPYTLMKPTYTLTEPGYGPFSEDLMVSPRVAPHMIGLGLLEAIPQERLEALADPDDEDGDGVSGRIQWQEFNGEVVPGRFGWKAEAPNIVVQVANAFLGDMGLTSEMLPDEECTDAQTICDEVPNGGEPEVQPNIFERVVLYSRAVAVPVRRAADDPTVLKGKSIFHRLGCATCHVPSHTTGEGAIPEFSNQLIWPYTDLLLHDMGPGLADNTPVGNASGQEWKTPPLWGLGLVDEVSNHTRFLHDGRARNLEEAVLWHGGEALAAKNAFLELKVDERTALIRFLEDL